MTEITREVPAGSVDRLQKILGNFDENANVIMRELGINLRVEGLNIVVSGAEDKVSMAADVLECLVELAADGDPIDGAPIKCKTVGQKRYADAIKKDTVVFGVGPAGTGKTYLAVCLAVQAYKSKQVEKIILTRPAVEAGEKLGFLPGDLQTKVDPYLRPLYDALQEMLGLETYTKLMERGSIEIAPLAYMRGRTLSNAFVILDEAQNTTREQMKMFLTRMGDGSKMVITGDVTQIDLPEGKKSGLVHAVHVLKDIEGIAICRLTDKDVVRHPLVMKIVRAYEIDSKRSESEKGEKQ